MEEVAKAKIFSLLLGCAAIVTVEGEVEVVMLILELAEKMKEVSTNPAMLEVTNGRVFVIVTAPVEDDTEIPVPAIVEET